MYRHIWLYDFEYIEPEGGLPDPVCMCAFDLVTERTIKLWGPAELRFCPFDTGPDSVFVAYNAAAEISCHLALNWPIPSRILDLYVEFRLITNSTQRKRGLLDALIHFGEPHIDHGEKEEMRARVMAGPPWTAKDRDDILAYCMEDVTALQRLIPHFEPIVAASPRRWSEALLRARYMASVARMKTVGVPLDVDLLNRLETNWKAIQLDLIHTTDSAYGVYDETGSFKQRQLAALVERLGLADRWPRTKTGMYSTESDTLKEMVKLCPELQDLKELLSTIGGMKLFSLTVGGGRNRCSLWPFGTKTGRNAPSSAEYVFGPATWMRSLVRPEPDRPLVYADWSAQEIAVAASLSGDERLIEAVRSGDPYISFGVSAGLLPPEILDLPPKEAKKAAGRRREQLKQCTLGINYGMSCFGLARRIGVSEAEARILLQLNRETYPVFARWREDTLNRGLLGYPLRTCFGWALEDGPGVKPNTLKNFLVQGTAAEVLRLCCSSATEAGVRVCGPVHDALLSEAHSGQAAAELEEEVRTHMDHASETVLGFKVHIDATSITFPERYFDGRGRAFFERIVGLLERVERGTEEVTAALPLQGS